MLVMFLCMLIGFGANKLKLAPDNTATVLSKLENYFFVPALIINTFMKYCTVQSVSENYQLILYSAIALVIAIVIAAAAVAATVTVTADDLKRPPGFGRRT